jgi:hypothetical protein
MTSEAWLGSASADKAQVAVASGIETICVDAINFNGKGAVNCLPPEKLASLMTDNQKLLLPAANKTALTAKG